jgi:hypothetical protein
MNTLLGSGARHTRRSRTESLKAKARRKGRPLFHAEHRRLCPDAIRRAIVVAAADLAAFRAF